MRALRLCLVGTVTLALLGGMSSAVATQASDAIEAKYVERAWTTIRDGVFVDEAEWESRLGRLGASDEQEVRELRRLVRDQVKLLASLGLGDPWNSRFACLAEARSAVERASEDLDEGLTSLIRGRPNAERVLRDGRERLREYWKVRDEVDCSTAGEVAAFLASGWKDIGLPYRPINGRRLTYEYVASGEKPRFEGNALRVDGDTTYETWEWSDPLLPTDLTNRMNMATFSGDWDGMVIVASLLFEGPEGYWTGTGQGRTWVLSGHGVYEGLSAILSTTADIEADTLTVEGAIYAGPLPPVPEPPRMNDDETLDAGEPTPGPTADAADGIDEPTATSDRGIAFVIEPGQAVSDIMESLVDAGLLLDSEAFQSSVMRDLVRRLIEPGTYDVSRPMSLHDVIELLAGQRFDTPAGSDDTEVEFVIEPGQTVDEIEAALVEQGLLADTVAFRYLLIEGRVDELIAPGAYLMRTTMTPRQIVQRLAGAPDPPAPVVTLDMRSSARVRWPAGSIRAARRTGRPGRTPARRATRWCRR